MDENKAGLLSMAIYISNINEVYEDIIDHGSSALNKL